MLNGRGELVGVNFDRVWENVANDFGWNQDVGRIIAVDVRYLLWALEARTARRRPCCSKNWGSSETDSVGAELASALQGAGKLPPYKECNECNASACYTRSGPLGPRPLERSTPSAPRAPPRRRPSSRCWTASAPG